VKLGRQVAERSIKVNSRAGYSGKPGGPLRLRLLLRAIVAVMAIVPGVLALQAVAGQAASAAAAPAVTSVSPSSGIDSGGTSVTISGSGFTGATAPGSSPPPAA
jgi:IPT/TIG domain